MATVVEGQRPWRHRVMPWLAPPGPSLGVRPEDRFLVSYPRSGNTWVRFMLTTLLAGTPADFQSIERHVPDIYRVGAGRLWQLSSPRFLKSHEPATRRYPVVVYLIRDPRDVALSYYHYRAREGVIEGGLTPPQSWMESFAAGTADPYFGSWSDHVEGWLDSGHPALTVIRYEDALADPETALESISAAFGIRATREALKQAVNSSSPTRMRQLDRADVAAGRTWSRVRTGHDFVRRAASGGGKQELSQRARDHIESRWSHVMHRLGYD